MHKYNVSSVSEYHYLGWLKKLISSIVSEGCMPSNGRPAIFSKSSEAADAPLYSIAFPQGPCQCSRSLLSDSALAPLSQPHSSSHPLLLLSHAVHSHLVRSLWTSDKRSTYLILSPRSTACIYHRPGRHCFQPWSANCVPKTCLGLNSP